MTRVDLARLSDVASGIPSGTSFPGTPADNDLFYRTDLDFLCFYNGTIWLTTQILTASGIPEGTAGAVLPTSTDNALFIRWPLWQPTHDAYLLHIRGATLVNTTNTGAAYWTVYLRKASDNANIGSFNTSADTPDVLTNHLGTINAASTEKHVYLRAVKTGAPGTLYPFVTLHYRLVIT